MVEPDAMNSLRELADREAIRHCIMLYCRGIDRLDSDVLQKVYWPGATDDHVNFVGTGEQFIERAMTTLDAMDQTQHLVGNVLINLDGPDAADSESYFQAFHRLRADDGVASDLLVGGRYVDRFEKRGGHWRISSRVVIIDWFRQFADSGDFSSQPLGLVIQPGARKPDDRSYRLMKAFS